MVGDVFPDGGALGGIYSGLRAAPGDAALCVACDMPFVSASLVAYLAGRAAEADVVIPDAAGELQPLHAVYGKACLPAMERRLRAGQLKVVGLFDEVRVVRVPADAVERFADPSVAFMNLNTPEDLARARALWDRRPAGAGRAPSGPRRGWGRDGRLRDTRVAGLELGSLQELNGLPAPLRDGLYGRLIPSEICARFGVDPATGLNAAGHRLLRVFAPSEQSWARIELRASRDDRDPLVLVDVEMGPFAVPELSFVQVTDPGRSGSRSIGTRTARTRCSAP